MRIIGLGLIFLILFGAVYGQKPQRANTPPPIIQNAVALIEKQQFNEAERILREFLKTTPDSVDAKFLIGTLLIRANKIPEGITFLKNVLKTDPKHLQANYNLALIYSAK